LFKKLYGKNRLEDLGVPGKIIMK